MVVGGPDDCQHVADLGSAALGRASHDALSHQSFCRRAPCYHPGLDLACVAPDRSFAAYVGVAWDEVNRRAMLEPVCTHPDHRGRGLSEALICMAIGRLVGLGARDLTVGTGDMVPANQLYDRTGFTETARSQAWRRSW